MENYYVRLQHMSQPTERLHAFDSLRGSMMLLGLVLHSAIPYMEAPLRPELFPLQDQQRSALFDLLVFFIHNFRMPLFFLLAGFFGRMVLEKLDWKEFLRHRLLRLGIPLVLFLPPLLWLSRHYALGLGIPAAEIPVHLSVYWFLYFLIGFTLVAALLSALGVPTGVGDQVFAKVWFSWAKWPVLVGVTAGFLWTQYAGTIDPDTRFVPVMNVPLVYAWFYGVGWMLFPLRHTLEEWTRPAWKQMLLAVVLLVPYLACIGVLIESFKKEPTPLIRSSWTIPEPAHTIAALLGGAIAWLLIFGISGLFLRYLGKPSRWTAYLAGAAYWVYLAHFFVVLVLASLLLPMGMPIYLKFVLLLVGVTLFSFGSFELLVRGRPWAYVFGAGVARK